MKRAALFVALVCVWTAAADAQSPLERRVSLRVRDIALRDALDRVAALAGIRVSYSAETLPLDRRVSIALDTSTVGEVLDALLRFFPVQAVEVGDDHIVLTPREMAQDTSRRSTTVLERVVVTGSVAGAPERSLTMALDVVPGRAAERRAEGTLATLLDGSVPGMWLWEQGPGMVAHYGSIRGASSFSLSYPKVYLDGIEVANPLLFTHVMPELVERVEVIRGPQGASLYGSDAISGVVNIVSRHDGTAADGGHAVLRSQLGWAQSAFGPTPTPTQEHSLSLRGGTNLRSTGIAIGGSTTGDFIPNAYSHALRAVGDARIIGAASTITFNARAHGKRSGVPVNPLLPFDDSNRIASDAEPQALDTYSVGSTYKRAVSEDLTYSLTAGVDGYRLRNISIESTPVPSSSDSALRAANGGADRTTLRASAVKQFGDFRRVAATVTVAAEQSILRDRTHAALPGPASGPGPGRSAVVVDDWSRNTGITTQTNIALKEAVYLTAGARLERITPTPLLTVWEQLPMVGVAVVHDFAKVTAKFRGSYGRGIRLPRASAYGPLHEPRRAVFNPLLAPEEQAGIDAGFDLFIGRVGSVHLTRFDQRATGLIQAVTLYDTTASGMGKDRVYFQLQNVGEITNQGWEAKASLDAGILTLAATGSQVDSRVRKLALGYRGDLRPGDRMLAVPERTGSLTAGVVRRVWHTSWTVSRALNWVNYDRLAIADVLHDANKDDQDVTGERLRTFWVNYPGATRVRGTFGIELSRGLGLSLTGENLTDAQRGEPDTITILPGRTVTLGVRARF